MSSVSFDYIDDKVSRKPRITQSTKNKSYYANKYPQFSNLPFQESECATKGLTHFQIISDQLQTTPWKIYFSCNSALLKRRIKFSQQRNRPPMNIVSYVNHLWDQLKLNYEMGN